MKTPSGILHWTARIICILAILFISLFAFDAFSPGQTTWQQISSLLIHLIPSFVLLATLLVAWKWELTGGIILTVIGFGLCIFIFKINFSRLHSVSKALIISAMLALPFVISGLLFIISHFRKIKARPSE